MAGGQRNGDQERLRVLPADPEGHRQPSTVAVAAHAKTVVTVPIAASGYWYDFSVKVAGQSDYSRRFAGRMETGADSISDPSMHGTAVGDQYAVGA